MTRTKRLAVFVVCHTAFGQGVVRGVMRYCKTHGSWEIEVEPEHTPATLARVLEAVEHSDFDGIISEIWYSNQLRALQAVGIPSVEVSGSWDTMNPVRVQSDNEAVGRLAARHLMERGLRNFAYFAVTFRAQPVLHVRQRRQAFVSELRRHGHDCDVFMPTLSLRYVAGASTEQGPLIRWLTSLPKPVGLLCPTDFQVKQVILAARQGNIRIPEEVALVGVGNDEFTCEICSVPISSVDLAPLRTGYVAASVIDRMCHGRTPPKRPVLVEPAGVIVRQSSDILTAENPCVTGALRFIQLHAQSPIEVRDVLKEIPISRRALEHNFKALLGRTPSQHIFHVRVEMAKRMLVETGLPLAVVAERCGFTSASIFSAIFRRSMGLRPGEYRRQYRVG